MVAQEFKACLLSDMAASLQLSRQDVNTLLTEVDVSGDGLIQYEVPWPRRSPPTEPPSSCRYRIHNPHTCGASAASHPIRRI